jgi:hypothetical protein
MSFDGLLNKAVLVQGNEHRRQVLQLLGQNTSNIELRGPTVVVDTNYKGFDIPLSIFSLESQEPKFSTGNNSSIHETVREFIRSKRRAFLENQDPFGLNRYNQIAYSDPIAHQAVPILNKTEGLNKALGRLIKEYFPPNANIKCLELGSGYNPSRWKFICSELGASQSIEIDLSDFFTPSLDLELDSNFSTAVVDLSNPGFIDILPKTKKYDLILATYTFDSLQCDAQDAVLAKIEEATCKVVVGHSETYCDGTILEFTLDRVDCNSLDNGNILNTQLSQFRYGYLSTSFGVVERVKQLAAHLLTDDGIIIIGEVGGDFFWEKPFGFCLEYTDELPVAPPAYKLENFALIREVLKEHGLNVEQISLFNLLHRYNPRGLQDVYSDVVQASMNRADELNQFLIISKK